MARSGPFHFHQSGWLAAGLMVLAVSEVAAQDWRDAALTRAHEVHLATLPDSCAPESFGTLAGQTAHWPLFLGEGDAAREALLVRFPCLLGAYNEVHVFVLSDQNGVATPVFFPSPQISIRWVPGSGDAIAEAITQTGEAEMREVVNPDYDPDARVVTEYNKWRGLGDAHSMTRWGYVEGRFRLMRFEVDASYDGEINPVLLISRDIW